MKNNAYYFMVLVSFLILLTMLGLAYRTMYINKINVLEQVNSEQGNLWVYEIDGKICLSFLDPKGQGCQKQSCIDPNYPSQLYLTYYKLMTSTLYLNPHPQNILIIGLGGGILINLLSSLFPDATLDVVEINQAVIEIAKKYFTFRPTNNIQIFNQDGFRFVADLPSKPTYDLIIVDAFTEDYVPMSFLTEEFIGKIKEILQPEGVAGINTFENSRYYKLESALYKKIFGKFYTVTKDNRIILVSKDSLPNITKVVHNAKLLEKRLTEKGVDTEWLLSKFVLND